MLTKIKIALVLAGSLITGVAAAQGTQAPQTKADFKAKFEAKRAEMIQKFDTNKDGKLDDNERAAAREAMTLQRFQKLDTDNNGVLSLAEFKAGKQHMGRHARGGGMKHGFGRGRHGGKGRGLGTTK